MDVMLFARQSITIKIREEKREEGREREAISTY